MQGVFKRIYECLLEDGVARPEQIACPPHLPTAQQMQLVRSLLWRLRCDNPGCARLLGTRTAEEAMAESAYVWTAAMEHRCSAGCFSSHARRLPKLPHVMWLLSCLAPAITRPQQCDSARRFTRSRT